MSARSALRDLRRLGFVGSAAYYIPRAVARVSRGRCTIFPIAFYAVPVPTDELVRDTGTGITVKALSHDSIPESKFGRPDGVVAQRFAAGHTCIGAANGSDLMGFMWISLDDVEERLVRCVFEPGPKGQVAWDYDFFIAPRYRLGRTFARLWDGARSYLTECGVRASISWIEPSNIGSIRAHERLGARRVGWAAFVSLWGAQLTVCSVPPYFHWSAPGGAAVRIRVKLKAGLFD